MPPFVLFSPNKKQVAASKHKSQTQQGPKVIHPPPPFHVEQKDRLGQLLVFKAIALSDSHISLIVRPIH
ncbi:hypothetical protein FACS1894159_03830 [Bacteroidia bacterium]|nr:hypothetical protein FACS1894159_03830 [Bacteroidia bacterium]